MYQRNKDSRIYWWRRSCNTSKNHQRGRIFHKQGYVGIRDWLQSPGLEAILITCRKKVQFRTVWYEDSEVRVGTISWSCDRQQAEPQVAYSIINLVSSSLDNVNDSIPYIIAKQIDNFIQRRLFLLEAFKILSTK